jgi:hypothetical protein
MNGRTPIAATIDGIIKEDAPTTAKADKERHLTVVRRGGTRQATTLAVQAVWLG